MKEPFLLCLSTGLAIQVKTFTCLCYLALSLLFIVPAVLTRKTGLIWIKMVACLLLSLLALGGAVLKSLVLIHIKDSPIVTFPNMGEQMAVFWGLKSN